jgi:hypothetical protein
MILTSSICLRQIYLKKKNKRKVYTHLIQFTFIDDFFSYKSPVDQMIIIRINFVSKYLAVCRLKFRNGVDIKETAHLSLINQ